MAQHIREEYCLVNIYRKKIQIITGAVSGTESERDISDVHRRLTEIRVFAIIKTCNCFGTEENTSDTQAVAVK